MRIVHVDGMLDREPIGGPVAEGHRVGVAEHDSRLLADYMRHFAALHALAPALDVVGVRRLDVADVARVDSIADVVEIDREHRFDVALAGRAHPDRALGWLGPTRRGLLHHHFDAPRIARATNSR